MYEVVVSKVWKRDDGRTASIYGAVPWQSDDEATRWKLVETGFTVKNTQTGTIGVGKQPFQTREEAQFLADKLNRLRRRD